MNNVIGMNVMKEMQEKERIYKKVNDEINNKWPEWKKKVYNEIFAVSAHAEKLNICN